MKRISIDRSEYLEAPIDDKNVLSDSLIESLFDDNNYAWERNEAMGFINGFPCLARYGGNKLSVRYVGYTSPGTDTFWAMTVVERITGATYDWKTEEHLLCHSVTLLDDETSEGVRECQLISGFEFTDDLVETRFYWNLKK